MRYVPALDGLRALAVMLVFLFHRGKYFPGGWIGVDMFFVLSGYLITSILVAEHEATGRISLRRFYRRRACRLLPALVVVTGVALAIAILFHDRARDTEIDAAAALFYVIDYRYALFSPTGTALGHVWSLAVEEQFYLFWPLLLIALLRRNRQTALRATLALIVVIAVWRIFLFAVLAHPFRRIYFAFDTRADELLIGCALALWRRPQALDSRIFRALWPAVLAFLAAVVLGVGPTGRWLGYIDTIGFPLLALAAAYLIVVLTSERKNYLTYLFSLPWVVAFGRISYGFYLWHYLIIQEQPHLFLNKIWIAFALSLSAATLSYLVVERPFLRLGRSGARPLRRFPARSHPSGVESAGH